MADLFDWVLMAGVSFWNGTMPMDSNFVDSDFEILFCGDKMVVLVK
jgi:hypothetical protein